MFTYDEQTLSDLHKDARGFRPRSQFCEKWEAALPEEKQEIWDTLCLELEENMAAEALKAEHAAETLKAEIEGAIMGLASTGGETSRRQALVTITQSENSGLGVRSMMDAEYWLWGRGCLHTKFGNEVLDDFRLMFGE